MTAEFLTRQPAADPTEIYRYRDGLHAVDLLAAALVEFDLFSRLAKRAADLPTICRELGLQERALDVALTLFVADGFLRREGEVIHVTELAREFLVRGSPWFVGPYYAALKDRPVAQDYVKVLRTGKPANWGSLRNEKEWVSAMEEESFARNFTAAMDCRGVYLGRVLAEKLDCRGCTHLLDVAGGSGIYACCLVARHSHLRATVLEKPPVDKVAARAIAERGCADRVSVVAGDMFTDAWPTTADAHLLSNVLHDWDVPVVKQLLRSSFAALPPGGLLVIHDAFLNADKSGPVAVARYSALLMHATEGRCYSVAEMEAWLREAGFGEVNYFPTAVDRGAMTARKP
ncbi:MAG: methyltransferase [Verrucomicrobia bacterium]|nr:methyltransferase [Verrucomicrobiota bacterium]